MDHAGIGQAVGIIPDGAELVPDAVTAQNFALAHRRDFRVDADQEEENQGENDRNRRADRNGQRNDFLPERVIRRRFGCAVGNGRGCAIRGGGVTF